MNKKIKEQENQNEARPSAVEGAHDRMLSDGRDKAKEKNYYLPILYFTYFRLWSDIANAHGYCLATHGSMKRDFDLLAVPWVDNPKQPDELAIALSDNIISWNTEDARNENIDEIMKRKTLQPHGRISYDLSIGGGGYIDLSIVTPFR